MAQKAYGHKADYQQVKGRRFEYTGPTIPGKIEHGAIVSRRQYDKQFAFRGSPYQSYEEKAAYRRSILGLEPGYARGRKRDIFAEPPTEGIQIGEDKGWRTATFDTLDEAILYTRGTIASQYPSDLVMIVAKGIISVSYTGRKLPPGKSGDENEQQEAWKTLLPATRANSLGPDRIREPYRRANEYFDSIEQFEVYWRPARANRAVS